MKYLFKNPYSLQILSSFIFAILGMQIKLLSEVLSIESIVFYRCFFGTILLFILIIIRNKKKKKNFLKTTNWSIQMLRACFGTLAMLFGYSSLTMIPLAQASTLSFTKVFFVSFLAYFFLKEKIRYQIIYLAIIGFIGIYMMINPQEFESINGSALALISAFFVAAGIISVSFLAQTNNTITILFYHSFFSTILCMIFFYTKIDILVIESLISLVIITLTALVGQYFNASSYRDSEANIVVLFGYTRIVFAIIIGFLIFDENIGLNFLMGLILIIFSSVLTSRLKTN